MPKAQRKAVAKSKSPAKTESKPPNPPAKAKAATAKSKSAPVFFCEPDTSSEGDFLSPWWQSDFQVKDVVYVKAGQYILAEKARVFGDKKTLQHILEAETTEELIGLGDRIKGVDEKVWRRRAPRIARQANIHKFTSDDTESRELFQRLMNLGGRELVFADAEDDFLGIGFSEADAQEVDRGQWGDNVFGKSLDAVRKIGKATGMTADKTKKRKTQTTKGYTPFDTSVFDIGGRMSINW